jgi:hypothetical protein
MTKKDYELLAAAMYRAWVSVENDCAPAVRMTSEMLADALTGDNPNFDRGRFLAACQGVKKR